MQRPIALFFCTLVLGISPTAALSQAFPSKPVKFVVGSAAGSTPDAFARQVAQKMTESLGTQVIVDNRPGASGTLAADNVAKAPADGYTLLFSESSSWAINPHLFSKLPYDPLKNLAPIIQLGTLPMFLVAGTGVPASTPQELIAHLKGNPGVSYASAGNGSIHHISAELFKSMAGVQITHVPYKGASQIGVALMSGEVPIAFMGYTGAAAGVTAGKIKVIAVGTQQRSEAFPKLPTLSESGLKGFDMYASVGILAPAGTPPAVIAKIHAAAHAAASSPDVVARLAQMGIQVQATSTAQFTSNIAAEHQKFARLVKLSGARVE